MFGSNDDHLVLLFEYGLGSDTRGPWQRLLGEFLESPAEMLRSLLAWAITHDQRHRVALLAALHVAAQNGNLALARTLLELGADPNIPDKHYRSTPLGWARHFDQPTLVKLLEPLTAPDCSAGLPDQIRGEDHQASG
jgi:ankyrin repeat protein